MHDYILPAVQKIDGNIIVAMCLPDEFPFHINVVHAARSAQDNEFIVYGCSCVEKGKIVYHISPSVREILRFKEQAALNNQNMTEFLPDNE